MNSGLADILPPVSHGQNLPPMRPSQRSTPPWTTSGASPAVVMDAATLVEALGGRWYGAYGVARCPAHDDETPSLAVRDAGGGRVLVHCHAGCSQVRVINELQARGLWPGKADVPRESDPAERKRRGEFEAAKRRRRTAEAGRIWRGSLLAEDTAAAAYLRGRGLVGTIPPTLRYHAALRYPYSGLSLPAMVAAVTTWPGREIVAVHRTYLIADGTRLAGVSEAKLSLGPIKGGAVRLAPVGARLVVGEGIETTLSVQQAASVPGWAALCAGGIEALILPPLPLAGLVLIAADNDASGRGQLAARHAAERWRAEGRTVRILLPERVGSDWNDVLCGAADVAC